MTQISTLSIIIRRALICSILLVLVIVSYAQGVTVNTKDISCFGRKDGEAEVVGGNGAQPYTYAWSHNALFSARRVIDLPKGFHHVTVTDANGCTAILDFEIKEPPDLKLRLQTIDVQHDFCANNFCVTVEAFATGGTEPYHYSPKVQTRCSPGPMYFVVIDKNGCVEPAMTSLAEARSACRGSIDPNDIVGPSGYGDLQWMSVNARHTYMIRYENDPVLATGPAQYVEIRHEIDSLVRPLSLRIHDFGFGPYVFDVPDNTSFYQKRLDLVDDLGIYLDVVAGLDAVNHQAFWTFESIDPATGLRPTDLTVGFLPPNDTLTDDGQGFVTFSVLPLATAQTRDTVEASATIIFDKNEAIGTNTWQNTIDALPPGTQLTSLPDTTMTQVIALSWQGQDDPLGSGISYYDLYSAKDGGLYTASQVEITDTFTTFIGEPGSTYQFYILGVDHTGNKEVKTTGEDGTFILPEQNLALTSPLSQARCVGDTLLIDWDAVLVDSVDVYLSLDSGMTYQLIYAGALSANVPYSWPVPDTLGFTYASVRIQKSNDVLIRQGPIFPIRPLPEVNAGLDKNVCINGITNLIGSGANTYQWAPQYNLGQPLSFSTAAYPDTTTMYYLTGMDFAGCQNTDSVLVTVYPTYQDTIVSEICNGDSIFVGGGYQTEAGFYTDELISSVGCDSTVITHVVVTGPCPFPSEVVYVDKDATGLNNGTSWTNAFTDLQDALTAVDHYFNVHEIWIAEGLYFTSPDDDRTVAFFLKDSVEIYGGFTGIETMREERIPDASLVRLSGDIGIDSDSTDNAYHIFRVDPSCEACVLDGMTVQFGQADFIFNQGYIGAGILNEGTLLLENCIVERNTSLLEGAAIYNTGVDADLIVRDCIFRLNYSGVEHDILNGDGAQIHFQGLIQIQN